ncbi:MAG: hypothetical protein COV73_00735, partial [Candidatus Omnitrophica bacterium CG11_big_fil_rev_8_21_14_0_20_43_6]
VVEFNVGAGQVIDLGEKDYIVDGDAVLVGMNELRLVKADGAVGIKTEHLATCTGVGIKANREREDWIGVGHFVFLPEGSITSRRSNNVKTLLRQVDLLHRALEKKGFEDIEYFILYNPISFGNTLNRDMTAQGLEKDIRNTLKDSRVAFERKTNWDKVSSPDFGFDSLIVSKEGAVIIPEDAIGNPFAEREFASANVVETTRNSSFITKWATTVIAVITAFFGIFTGTAQAGTGVVANSQLSAVPAIIMEPVVLIVLSVLAITFIAAAIYRFKSKGEKISEEVSEKTTRRPPNKYYEYVRQIAKADNKSEKTQAKKDLFRYLSGIKNPELAKILKELFKLQASSKLDKNLIKDVNGIIAKVKEILKDKDPLRLVNLLNNNVKIKDGSSKDVHKTEAAKAIARKVLGVLGAVKLEFGLNVNIVDELYEDTDSHGFVEYNQNDRAIKVDIRGFMDRTKKSAAEAQLAKKLKEALKDSNEISKQKEEILKNDSNHKISRVRQALRNPKVAVPVFIAVALAVVFGAAMYGSACAEKISHNDNGGHPGDDQYSRGENGDNGNQDNATADSTQPVAAPVTNTSVDTITDYSIQSGDSLWIIADKFYGDAEKWHDLYALNKDVIDARNAGAPENQKYWLYTDMGALKIKVTSVVPTTQEAPQSVEQSNPTIDFSISNFPSLMDLFKTKSIPAVQEAPKSTEQPKSTVDLDISRFSFPMNLFKTEPTSVAQDISNPVSQPKPDVNPAELLAAATSVDTSSLSPLNYAKPAVETDAQGRPTKITAIDGSYKINTYASENEAIIVKYDQDGNELDRGKVINMPVYIRSQGWTEVTGQSLGSIDPAAGQGSWVSDANGNRIWQPWLMTNSHIVYPREYWPVSIVWDSGDSETFTYSQQPDAEGFVGDYGTYTKNAYKINPERGDQSILYSTEIYDQNQSPNLLKGSVTYNTDTDKPVYADGFTQRIDVTSLRDFMAQIPDLNLNNMPA